MVANFLVLFSDVGLTNLQWFKHPVLRPLDVFAVVDIHTLHSFSNIDCVHGNHVSSNHVCGFIVMYVLQS